MFWTILMLSILGLTILLMIASSIINHIARKRALKNHSEKGETEK